MSLYGKEQCQVLSFQGMGLEPYSLDIRKRSDIKKLEDVAHPNGRYFFISITQHSVRCHPNCIEQVLQQCRGGGIPFRSGNTEHSTKQVALPVDFERYIAF